MNERYILVVPNCVLSLLARMPWRPKLALMRPMPTKVRVFDQAGTALSDAMLGWPAFQNAMAAAMVRRVQRKEPVMSQMRFVEPILSPARPMREPAMKERREHRACWSALWKVVSRWVGEPSNRRAMANASCFFFFCLSRGRQWGDMMEGLPGQSCQFGNHTKQKWQKSRERL